MKKVKLKDKNAEKLKVFLKKIKEIKQLKNGNSI